MSERVVICSDGNGNALTTNEAAHYQAVVRSNDASANYRARNLGTYIADPANHEAEAPEPATPRQAPS